jgi:hypothetical protein
MRYFREYCRPVNRIAAGHCVKVRSFRGRWKEQN